MVAKTVMVLGVLAALGFWLSTLMSGSLFGISETHYLKEVVVLGFVLMGMRSCSCCCGGCNTCSVEEKM